MSDPREPLEAPRPISADESRPLADPTAESGAPESRWERETFDYDRLHLRIQKIAREVLREDSQRVLELGCGVGVMRAELLRQRPGLDYSGCDISHAAVAALGDPRIVQRDLAVEGAPFPDESFDCITGSGILEYIPELPAFLVSLRRQLTPAGRLIVSYYNMDHINRRVMRALGGSPRVHPDWRNRYSLSDLEGVLQGAGYEVTRSVPVDLCIRRPVTKSYQSSAARWAQEKAPFQHAFAAQMIFVCTKAVTA